VDLDQIGRFARFSFQRDQLRLNSGGTVSSSLPWPATVGLEGMLSSVGSASR
jgi:hypothetical protein